MKSNTAKYYFGKKSPLQTALPLLYGSITFTHLEENPCVVKLPHHVKKQRENLYG
jgi:hypothetical protein